MEVTITNLGGSIRIVDNRDETETSTIEVLKDGVRLQKFGDICRILFKNGTWIDIRYDIAEVIGFKTSTIPTNSNEFLVALQAVLTDYNGGTPESPYNFSFKLIESDVIIDIPEQQQMTVFGAMRVDGVLNVNGELILTDLDSSSVDKSIDVDADKLSNIKVTTAKAVYDWATGLFTTASDVASLIASALTGYATQAWVNAQGFLTSITSGDVLGALGYTPADEVTTITINGVSHDLSANRTWKNIWIDNTTGTVNSGNSITVSKTQLIQGGTFATGNIIQSIFGSINKTGSNGAFFIRAYINTTANLSGSPILVGLLTGANVTQGLRRLLELVIKSSTVTEIPSATSSYATDFGQVLISNVNIDWSTDKYFVFTIQTASGLDSCAISFYRIMQT